MSPYIQVALHIGWTRAAIHATTFRYNKIEALPKIRLGTTGSLYGGLVRIRAGLPHSAESVTTLADEDGHST